MDTTTPNLSHLRQTRHHRLSCLTYRDNPRDPGGRSTMKRAPTAHYNDEVFAELVKDLNRSFPATDALNNAWFLNYWGQT